VAAVLTEDRRIEACRGVSEESFIIISEEKLQYFFFLTFKMLTRNQKRNLPESCDVLRDTFKACLQNCEKRLLASSRLPLCPHGTIRLSLNGFS
jgi:hypothetical protein